MDFARYSTPTNPAAERFVETYLLYAARIFHLAHGCRLRRIAAISGHSGGLIASYGNPALGIWGFRQFPVAGRNSDVCTVNNFSLSKQQVFLVRFMVFATLVCESTLVVLAIGTVVRFLSSLIALGCLIRRFHASFDLESIAHQKHRTRREV